MARSKNNIDSPHRQQKSHTEAIWQHHNSRTLYEKSLTIDAYGGPTPERKEFIA